MRIFYVNVIEQNAGWGAEYFVNEAFLSLGHTTYCVDFRKNRHRLYRYFLRAPDMDVFFLQRGDYFPIPLIKSVQVPRLFWASERFAPDQDRLLRSGLFDHTFFHNHDWMERAIRRGWVDPTKCSVLLNGFDETIHRQIQNVQRDIDVLFIGALTPRRKSILDKVNSHFKMTIASAFGEEMIRLFNRAKIVLNLHSFEYLDTETRVFEALGCGAFLLSEPLSQENPFSHNEFVEFDTVEDLCDKVQYFLSHDEERNRIAECGHHTALKSHTYTHRAQEIVDVMQYCLKTKVEQHHEAVRRDWRLHAYGLGEPFLRARYSLLANTQYSLSTIRRLLKEL
jgi:hypothetical protein